MFPLIFRAPADREGNYTLVEGDEMVDSQTAAFEAKGEEYCSNAENVQACAVASNLEFEVRLAYDDAFRNKEPSTSTYLSSVMTHLQTHFYHYSFCSRMTLKVFSLETNTLYLTIKLYPIRLLDRLFIMEEDGDVMLMEIHWRQ